MFSTFRIIPNILKIKISNCSFKMSSQSYSTKFEPKFFSQTGQSSSEEEFFENVSEFVRNVKISGNKGVLFIGENHQDPSAHQLELKILEKVFEISKKENLKFGFSLEFYDRSCQPVLNEFLSGFFDYETFVTEIGSGAPGNHEDYRPLLEFCRNFEIPVVASNCPRRYSKLVGKNGRKILEKFPEESKNFFAPIPYANPSADYCRNFLQVMNIFGKKEIQMTEKMERMLDAQSLWDATMAFSISESFEKQKFDFVAHVSGYFHVKHNLGILEHLRVYCSHNVLSHTFVMLPEDKPDFDEKEHSGLADTVVLTDLNQIE